MQTTFEVTDQGVRITDTVLDEDFVPVVGSEFVRRRWRTLAAPPKRGYRPPAWDETTSTLRIVSELS